jgi:hypothetical protein
MCDFMVLATLTEFKYRQSRDASNPLPFPYPAQFLDLQVYGGVRAHY